MKTTRKMKYPDMGLYQEIILLKEFFVGKWVVENVVPFYAPLIPAQKIGRHLFWSNFFITNLPKKKTPIIAHSSINELCKWHKIDLSGYKGNQRKDKISRNLVHYEIGLHIFNLARGILIDNNVNQGKLF